MYAIDESELNAIREIHGLIYSKNWKDHYEAVKRGYGWERLAKDEDCRVREAAIKSLIDLGYGYDPIADKWVKNNSNKTATRDDERLFNGESMNQFHKKLNKEAENKSIMDICEMIANHLKQFGALEIGYYGMHVTITDDEIISAKNPWRDNGTNPLIHIDLNL